jgi:GT2 family glycosyltransferase
MLDVLENDNTIGAVSPTTNANRERLARFEGSFKEVPVVTFFCVVLRSRIFGEIGFLDEEFGAGLWDDHDFCKRMQKAGYRCGIALNSFVYHHHRSTFTKVYSDEEIKEIHEKNMGRFKTKHGIK